MIKKNLAVLFFLNFFVLSHAQDLMSRDKNVKLSLSVGTMAFMINENPGLLEIMSYRYLNSSQTQHTGIDPSNRNALLLELGFEKTIKARWALQGRLSFRSFDDAIHVVYRDPSLPYRQYDGTHLVYDASENHTSIGTSISYNVFKETNKYNLKPYLGLDIRRSQLTQFNGTVYDERELSRTQVTHNALSEYHKEDRVHVDPLLGVRIQRGMILTDFRAQTFVKNKFRGENGYIPDVKDQSVMFSFSLGLVF